MRDDIDDSMLQDFIDESKEHLDSIEPAVLALERVGSDAPTEIIDEIFRAVHSIKGGAGFLSFSNLNNLSHSMESALMPIRDGEISITPVCIDALLAGIDRLRQMFADVESSDTVSIDDLVVTLDAFLAESEPTRDSRGDAVGSQSIGLPNDLPSQKPLSDSNREELLGDTIDLTSEEVRTALKLGQHVYTITVDVKSQLFSKWDSIDAFREHLEEVGDVLGSSVELGEPAERVQELAILYASVLEADLITTGVELPEDCFLCHDSKTLKDILEGKGDVLPPEPEESSPPVSESEEVSSADELDSQPQAEESLASVTKAPTDSTVRIRVRLLNRLMDNIVEMVLARNQLLRALKNQASLVPGLQKILYNVDRLTRELQGGIMQTRLQPVGLLFGRYRRVVRDLAKKFGKEIDLTVEGENVELDRSVIESLADPLTHLIRNCADHAIEGPDRREKLGKPKMGKILLRASHEGQRVTIEVTDDGGGIAAQKIREKAVQRHLVSASDVERMPEEELFKLIFAPGFSTAAQVTDVSGRGVGLDVVLRNIEKLGGEVEVHSRVGEGTTILLHLPLTIAIMPSLLVGVAGQQYAVPHTNVVQIVVINASSDEEKIEFVNKSPVLRFRERIIPLVRMDEVLVLSDSAGDGQQSGSERLECAEEQTLRNRCVIVVRDGENPFGLLVDDVHDSEDIVVRPLSTYARTTKCFSGATITSEGRAVLILDVAGLSDHAELVFEDDEQKIPSYSKSISKYDVALDERNSYIVFTNHQEERFAAPLHAVARMDKITPDQIERVGERELVRHQGRGHPLIRLERYLPVRPITSGVDELYILVPKQQTIPGGEGRSEAVILFSGIVDSAEMHVDPSPPVTDVPGFVGSMIFEERLTQIIDPQAIIQLQESESHEVLRHISREQ